MAVGINDIAIVQAIVVIKFLQSLYPALYLSFPSRNIFNMSSESNKIWMHFSGCDCLKSILISSGYDNQQSLKCLNDTSLIKLEKYVGKHHWITEKLSCDHAISYKTSSKFEFLPGHKALLLDWCQTQCQTEDPAEDFISSIKSHPAFSIILRELITNELNNYGKPANSRRFSQILIDFSIYIYIMAGKACYEVLCANLPFPKAGTVCK